MTYPATDNIKVLQNSTWRKKYRATSDPKPVTINTTTGVFSSSCHKLLVNTAVCISPLNSESCLPCGLDVEETYYVISDGLTTDQFKLSTVVGGAAIAFVGTPPDCFLISQFTVSRPINLDGYIVDSDIKSLVNNLPVASFTPLIADAVNGKFELSLQPAVTATLIPGMYGYDISLTSSGGERYYWVKGTVTIEQTYSRN